MAPRPPAPGAAPHAARTTSHQHSRPVLSVISRRLRVMTYDAALFHHGPHAERQTVHPDGIQPGEQNARIYTTATHRRASRRAYARHAGENDARLFCLACATHAQAQRAYAQKLRRAACAQCTVVCRRLTPTDARAARPHVGACFASGAFLRERTDARCRTRRISPAFLFLQGAIPGEGAAHLRFVLRSAR